AAVTCALGRVSAVPIVARWPSPRSDCSAMDGIAVSAAVLAGNSPTGNSSAGSAAAGRAAAGGAVRLAAGSFEWVDTGDPMPDGTDTVVMREWLLPQEDGSVVIGAGAGAGELAPGKNVGRAGTSPSPASKSSPARRTEAAPGRPGRGG